MRSRLLSCALLALTAAACAKPVVRAPQPPTEGYVFPGARGAEVSPEVARRLEEGWQAVKDGDLRRAEKSYREALALRPGLAAAETGLGYVALQQEQVAEAERRFQAALAGQPDYPPALVGGAFAALRRDDAETALTLFRRALAIDPREPVVKRRVAELRLQVTERRVAAARAALERGEVSGAIETYSQAIEEAPEVAGLRLELAEVLVRQGQAGEAVAVLETDPTGDRQVLLRQAELLVELREHARAIEAYRRLLERDPRDDEARRKAYEARQQHEMLQMPEEYRRIATAPQITRADLAALLSVKVGALSRAGAPQPKVAVDISGSWAREHIIRVLGRDIMAVYPNHTFQPGAVVRRGDLARALQQVLDLLGYPQAPVPALADLTRSSLHFYPAGRVVAAGLMDLTPSGAFEAWRPVNGEEAMQVVENLVRAVGP
ncbi:MAG: tetratricopeptide repeat protein [Vicinamibacteria bacterium]